MLCLLLAKKKKGSKEKKEAFAENRRKPFSSWGAKIPKFWDLHSKSQLKIAMPVAYGLGFWVFFEHTALCW